ncbi:MAG: hypothetical protein ABIN74_07440, partial [Ferruginibacter sp.]
MRKIYQVFLSMLFLLSITAAGFAQNSFFAPKSEAAIPTNNLRVIIPQKYNTVEADITQLK